MPKTNFLIFCLIFFALSFGVSAMAALVPSIALDFGVEPAYALRLTWLYMLPYGVMALVWSPLTRAVKLRRLFLISTFGFFLSLVFFSLSDNIQQAFTFRFINGCFASSFVPLLLITVGKSVSGKNKAKYLGVFFGISYIATLLGVFLSGFIPWRLIYFIPAVLSLGVLILMLFYLNDFDFRKERFTINYLDTLRDKKVLRFFIVIMLGSFIYHSLQQRLGVYLRQAYSLGQPAISLIFTVSILSATIFEFAGGFFNQRFGSIKLARAGFILMSVFSLALILTANYKWLFLTVILWGSGWALSHVSLSTHLAHFPDKALRDAASLNSALRFFFGGLGAYLGGFLVALFNFRGLFIISGLAVFLLGLGLNKIIQERKESYG